jgi:hypothetical protein
MTAERFPIEENHVLMFRRAVGGADPESGLPSIPPTFAIANAQFDPEYPLRPRPDVAWHGSGGGPGLTIERAGSLHAEQHFTYHRPLQIGDVLSGSFRLGDSWEKQGRSGTLKFQEMLTELRDEAGELVVTLRSVSVLTELAGKETTS